MCCWISEDHPPQPAHRPSSSSSSSWWGKQADGLLSVAAMEQSLLCVSKGIFSASSSRHSCPCDSSPVDTEEQHPAGSGLWPLHLLFLHIYLQREHGLGPSLIRWIRNTGDRIHKPRQEADRKRSKVSLGTTGPRA